MSKTIELLAEAGIIPSDVLEEMIRWRVVPPSVREAAGHRPLREGFVGPGQTRKELVASLVKTLGKEELDIKQTVLDEDGEFVDARAFFKSQESYVVSAQRRIDGSFLVDIASLTYGGAFPIRKVTSFLVDEELFPVESITPLYWDDQLHSFLYNVRRTR